MVGATTKICTMCKQEKPVTEFALHKNMKGGIYSNCKMCTSAIRKREYKKNPEYYKKKASIYFLNNKEKVYRRSAEYNKKKPLIKLKAIKKYSLRIVKEISDSYVRFLISRRLDIKQRDVPDYLIPFYRELLLLKRLSKHLKEGKEWYEYGSRKY